MNELQSDVVVSDDEMTGTLKYVDGYVDFSSNVSEQSGNYLALKIEAEPAEAETVVEIVGGTKGPVTLDDDMNIVLLIKNKDTQSIKVTTTHNEEMLIRLVPPCISFRRRLQRVRLVCKTGTPL